MPPRDPRAHAQVARAVKAGQLVRPDRCENCDAFCAPYAYHDDSARPLDVRWLCPRCHRREPRPEERAVVVRFDEGEFQALERDRGAVAREPFIREALRFYRAHGRVRDSAEAKRGVEPLTRGVRDGR